MVYYSLFIVIDRHIRQDDIAEYDATTRLLTR